MKTSTTNPIVEDQITRLHQAQRDARRAEKDLNETIAALKVLDASVDATVKHAENLFDGVIGLSRDTMREAAQTVLNQETTEFSNYVAGSMTEMRDFVARLSTATTDSFAKLINCETFDDLVNKMGALVTYHILKRIGMQDVATAYLGETSGSGEFADLLKALHKMKGKTEIVVEHRRRGHRKGRRS